MPATKTLSERTFYAVTRFGALSVVLAPIAFIVLLFSGLGSHIPGAHWDDAIQVVAMIIAAVVMTAALVFWRVSLGATPQETSFGGQLRFLVWSVAFWGYGAAVPLLSSLTRPLSGTLPESLATIAYFTVPMIALGLGLRGFSRLSRTLCLLLWLSALTVIAASALPTC
jgi:hypothetical protein